MKIVVQATHPGHVHFFKNYIREMGAQGHDIKILARDKDITCDLLDKYDLQHEVLLGSGSVSPKDPAGIFRFLKFEFNVFNKVKSYNPDLLVGMPGVALSHVGSILDIPVLTFQNNEHATLENKISIPFTDKICTHEYYWDDYGDKHLRYPSYHELAYLHPSRFTPNINVLDRIDVDEDEKIVVIRLVSWRAAHDIGQTGFSDIKYLVEKLENKGAKVLITSEDTLPDGLNDRRVDVPIEKMHDLLFYSDLFIGESATMACESAVLGTPAVYVSSIRLGYLDELESRYGLVFNFSGSNREQNGVECAIRILEENQQEKFSERHKKLVNDKKDATKVIINQTNEMLK